MSNLKHRFRADDERMIAASSLSGYAKHLLLYPFSSYASGVLVVFSLLLTLAASAGLFGLALYVIVFPWAIKYAFAIIQHTALGHATPPEFTLDISSEANLVFWKLLILIALLVVLTVFLADVGGFVLAALFTVFACLMIPAASTVLAIEDSLISTLNPIRLINIAARLKAAYVFSVMLYGLAFLFYATVGVVPFFLMFFCFLGFLYCLFLANHLLGFALYHQHEEFGIDPFYSEQRRGEKEDRLIDDALSKGLDRANAPNIDIKQRVIQLDS